MKTLIFGGKVVNEGKVLTASVVVDNDTITDIIEGTDTPRGSYDQIVDATGCFVLPGVIDDHVHFRDPGLTQKADMQTESRAAAFGGVTSYLDMPNTKPQTTTIDALEAKYADAAKKSHVNYASLSVPPTTISKRCALSIRSMCLASNCSWAQALATCLLTSATC